MGSPAQMTLEFPGAPSAHFYLHWGSPHYQIPNMASYVFATWNGNRAWSLDVYRQYIEDRHITDLPTEDGPTRENAHKWGVEHSYVYGFTEHGQVLFSYAHREIGGKEFAPVDGGVDRLDLYRSARRWARELRSNAYRRLKPHGLRSGIEGYDLDLIKAEFRITSESRPGVAETASSRAFHAGHDCGAAGCGQPLTLDPADQP